ncbi:phosphatase PAP2 family protein [Candidatus Parcubacteria bacterium]|nr:phosphatase PAP2 family protein [Candidatus Parcubacteria bacterium]
MKKNKYTFPQIHPTIHLALAIGLFIIAVASSRFKDVASWEISVFNFMYNLPNFWRPVFFAITQLGSIHMLALLVIFYLIKKHHHIVIRLLMSGTLAYLLAGFAKDIWGRGRPTEFLLDIVSLDYVVRGPGFPSGHTALATALALTIGHYLPRKYRWIVAVWIIGVGLSRMNLGIHFPIDIIGGFAIGWASYAIFKHVRLYDVRFRKIRKIRSPKKQPAKT